MRTVTRDGVSWRVVEPHAGNYEFWDDWENAQWEQDTLHIIDQFVTPDSTYLDVGAWIGPTALWAARHGARVIAVEPDPLALRYLGINVRRNHAAVEIFEGALSGHTGLCNIQADTCGWASSMTRIATVGTEVPCLTMPDLFDIYDIENCALVKVDIEGHEAILLEHAAPFLASLKTPLLVAMHEPWWSRPVNPAWFSGYNSVIGDFGGWNSILALP